MKEFLIKVVLISFMIATFAFGKDVRLLVDRPGETNYAQERSDQWYSAIVDAYLHLRIIGMKEVDAVPSDSLSQFLGKSGKYGLITSQDKLNRAAVNFEASHIMKIDYQLDSRAQSVHLSAKVYPINSQVLLLDYSTRFPIVSTSTYLDELTLKIAEAVKKPVDENYHSKLLTPILVTDMGMVKELGRTTVIISEEKETKYLEKAFATLNEIITERQNFWLAYFMAGEQYEKHRKFEEAAEVFDNLLGRRQFKWPELFIRAARNYRQAKYLTASEKTLAMAKKYKVNNFSYKFEYAKLQAALLEFAKADKAFNLVLEEAPNNPEALLYLAQRNNEIKKYSKAVTLSKKLISLNKFIPEANLVLGKSNRALGKNSEAIAALKDVVTHKGDRSEAHVILAEIYSKQKTYDSSAYHYTEALKERHDDADLLIITAKTYRLGKDDHGALRVLQNYSSNFPGDMRISKDLGLVYFAVKDTNKARQVLEHCINMNPPSKEVLSALADIYTAKADWQKVINVNKKRVPLLAKKTDVHFGIGRAYFELKNYTESEKYLRLVLKDNTLYKEANWYLGEILYSRNQFQTALTHYKREKKSGNSVALQEKILASTFKQKLYPAARNEANTLISLDSKSGYAYTHLALISLAEKKYAPAQKYVKKAALYGDVDSQIYKELGYGFAKVKYWNDAISAFNRYLTFHADDDAVYLKLAEVYSKAGKSEDAVQAYIMAHEFNRTKNREALAKAGHVLYKKKDHVRAEKMYGEYLQSGGLNEKALLNYAQIKYNKKQYAQAVAAIDKITSDFKRDIRVTKVYGQSKYHLKAYAVALPFLVKAIAKEPNSIELAEMCAITYEKTKNYNKAIPHLNTIVKRGTSAQKKEYGFHLAQVYGNLNQKEKAISQYRRNISLFPTDYRNHAELAKYYLDAKQYTATIKLLKGAAVKSGAPASLSKPLAIAYKKMKHNKHASIAYERYLKHNATDSTAWNELGDLYYVQKNYTKAIRAYSKAVTKMPTHKWAHYRLANSYYKVNKYKDAQLTLNTIWQVHSEDKDILELYTKVLKSTKDTTAMIQVYTQRSKLEPKNFKLNVELGEMLFKRNRDSDGVRAYNRALAIKNSSYPVRKKLIEYHVAQKNETEAFALITEGVKLFPKTSEIYLFRAEYHLRMNSLPKASLDLKKTVMLNPKNHRAFFSLGQLHLKLKEKKSAKAAFTKAVNLSQKNSEYRLALARVSLDLNHLKNAVLQGEALLKLEPKNADIIAEVGTYFQKSGKISRAEKLYVSALAIDENVALCYRNLGIIYYEKEKYELAEVNLDRYVREDMNDFTSLDYLADIKRGNGKKGDAVQLYVKAHRLRPDDDEVIFKTVNAAIEDENMGIATQTYSAWKQKKTDWIFTAQARIQEAKKKTSKAASLYDMALKLNKKNAFAYVGLGRIAKEKKNIQEAREHIGKALSFDHTNIESYIIMANTYFVEKMYVSARELLNEALSVYTNPSVYYYLAMVHSRERNHDEAVAVLKKGLIANPRDAQIHFALANEMLEAIKPHEALKQFSHVLESDPRVKIALKTYKAMGDIYYEQLLDNKNAKKYYKKFLREGGKSKEVKQKLSVL